MLSKGLSGKDNRIFSSCKLLFGKSLNKKSLRNFEGLWEQQGSSRRLATVTPLEIFKFIFEPLILFDESFNKFSRIHSFDKMFRFSGSGNVLEFYV